jgi:hypothetical protein
MTTVLWLLLACNTAPTLPEEAPAEASPLPLYEQLYAGEVGPEARRLGDRVRILVWLRRLSLSPEQQNQMKTAITDTQAILSDLQNWENTRDQQELAAFGPIYQGLETALAQGMPDETARAQAAQALAAARKTLEDPQAKRLKQMRAALDIAEKWTGTLNQIQQQSVGEALFFLREPTSPFLEETWPKNSFASLRRVSSDAPPTGSLDIGGLWSLDQGKTNPIAGLEGLQRSVIALMALSHSETGPALNALGASP